MKTYHITTSFINHGLYTIKANSKKEAEAKLWDGNYDKYQDDDASVNDSQEEIIEINKPT